MFINKCTIIVTWSSLVKQAHNVNSGLVYLLCLLPFILHKALLLLTYVNIRYVTSRVEYLTQETRISLTSCLKKQM